MSLRGRPESKWHGAERRKTREVRPRLREGTTAKEMAVGGQGVTWPRRGPDTGKASRVLGGADAVADKQGRAKASPSACFLFSPQWAWGAVKGQGVYLAERRGGV